MDNFSEDRSDEKTIWEMKDDLLWEAAQAGHEAVMDRLREKENLTSADKEAASRALDAMSRMFC